MLKRFLSHDAHPAVQFVKYGLAGGLATVVDVTLTFLLSWKVFPALTPDDRLVTLLGLSVESIEVALRSQHYFVNCAIAFLIANFVAYVANILWVFKPGRHSRRKELMLFYLVSGVSFLVGTLLAMGLIRYAGLMTSYAKIVNMVASVMINYAGRKYFIFKG